MDVEVGHGRLYGLPQCVFTPGHPAGSPAKPDTGRLVRVHEAGMIPVATGLDRPTSIEIRGHTAYVLTLTGEVWVVPLS
ncbi:MAG: hypothetical protein ABJA87_08625 [bacterium]